MFVSIIEPVWLAFDGWLLPHGGYFFQRIYLHVSAMLTTHKYALYCSEHGGW